MATDDVRKESSQAADWHDRTRLCRTLMGGTRAMRAAGHLYLPQEPKEQPKAYAARLARSTLFNAFKRTVTSYVGKPLHKDVVPSEEVPEDMVLWLENIDLRGRDVTLFAIDLFTDVLANGASFIFVEMPPPLEPPVEGAPVTLAQERATNHRPYWVHVKGEDFLGWRLVTVGSVTSIAQFRFVERALVSDGAFSEAVVEQVRVLEPGNWSVYREGEKGWFLAEQGESSLDVVPVVPVYAERAAEDIAEPVLADLAELNAEHWQSASDQRHILHIARVPILFATGFGSDAASGAAQQISPNAMISAPSGATLQYVEHSGAAITAGAADLQEIERRMAALGAEALAVSPEGGARTAFEVADVSGKSSSALGAWVKQLNDGMNQAWNMLAAYAGKAEDTSGELAVNRDWSLALRDPAELATLESMRNRGDLDRRTYLDQMQRRGVLTEDLLIDDVAELADAEMPEPAEEGIAGAPQQQEAA